MVNEVTKEMLNKCVSKHINDITDPESNDPDFELATFGNEIEQHYGVSWVTLYCEKCGKQSKHTSEYCAYIQYDRNSIIEEDRKFFSIVKCESCGSLQITEYNEIDTLLDPDYLFLFQTARKCKWRETEAPAKLLNYVKLIDSLKRLNFNPRPLTGNWDYGWALDLHSLSSIPMGPNEWGHETFATKRSEIGESLYLLKYCHDRSQINILALAASNFICQREELRDCSFIIPTPPSESRQNQPVIDLAKNIGAIANKPVDCEYLNKTLSTSPRKNLTGNEKIQSTISNAFTVIDNRYDNQHVLLFDDVFASGQTLNAITTVFRTKGNIRKISVVTLTQTRSRR